MRKIEQISISAADRDWSGWVPSIEKVFGRIFGDADVRMRREPNSYLGIADRDLRL